MGSFLAIQFLITAYMKEPYLGLCLHISSNMIYNSTKLAYLRHIRLDVTINNTCDLVTCI